MSNNYNSDIDPKDIAELAAQLGITLDAVQLNVGGERTIMSPYKQVLMGIMDSSGKRVVLKCARHPAGVKEIAAEHEIEETLKGLPFAEQELIMPTEIFYGEQAGFLATVTEYIDQEKVFTEYSLSDQFFMVLQILEAQEGFHATTREHHRTIRDRFTHHKPDFYLNSCMEMTKQITAIDKSCEPLLEKAFGCLSENQSVLKTMDGYLIHFDLVPHNFRIANRQIYLLDFVSFRLANKYEGWARLINFMEVHSPKLVPLLLDYVKKDRSELEYTSLRLMRIYKAIFLLHYYASTLDQTEGNLRTLTEARIKFWKVVIASILDNKSVPKETLDEYYAVRDAMRTDKEKERQRQFTWA